MELSDAANQDNHAKRTKNTHESEHKEEDSDDDIDALRRRRKQASPIGDFIYMGGDRVRSKDWPVATVSAVMIIAPSITTIIFTYGFSFLSLP